MKETIMPRIFLLSLLLTLCLPATAPAPTRAQSPVTYEVYAISYAIIPDFPVASLVAGTDRSRKLDIQMMVWLLKGSDGRNVLVDSGFYREKFFKDFKVRDFIRPDKAVERAGVRAEEITDIVLSHMHWDHADGLDLFPKARVWVQKDEYDYYTSTAWQPGGKHGGIEPEDVLMIVRLNTEGRVSLIDGDGAEPIKGIKVYTGGRHTYASQYAGVNTKSGTIVVASDNMYLYENLERHAPIAQTFDAASNLRAQDRMKQIASDPRLIVPGHDPLVFVKFPKPGGGVAKIE
jgi:glyoxylase-like metal-dependent hydrolase (beta-lactamase superfamily II)